MLALSKTWAFLRPDMEPVWTLLAATQRLFSKLEKKTVTRELIVAALLSAFAVCLPNPTSEASFKSFRIRQNKTTTSYYNAL